MESLPWEMSHDAWLTHRSLAHNDLNSEDSTEAKSKARSIFGAIVATTTATDWQRSMAALYARPCRLHAN